MTDVDLKAVTRVMAAAGIGTQGPLQARRLAAGRSNWTFKVSDGTSSWLLRRPPTGGLTPSAHDVGREHRITSALIGAAIPVAEPLFLCDDPGPIGAPFTIAAWVEGVTVQTAADLERLSDAQISATTDALVEKLARLHAVDYQAVGLADFARADGYAERQVKRWSGQWQRVLVEESADAVALLTRLGEAVPEQFRAGVIHGDYRIDNVILEAEDPSKILAIVDWELSTLGDPVADIALMASYRHPALSAVLGVEAAWASDRLPDGNELAARYEQISGTDLDNWEFYLALGFYKLAVIAQGIDHRYRAGATQGDGFDEAGGAVPEFFAAGLRALAAREDRR